MEYKENSCLCNWMEVLREDIGNLPLNKVLIPGAHDSNTYTIPKVKALSPFARCQTSSLYSQLCSGVRFFDLRVGDFASSELKQVVDKEMKDLSAPNLLRPPTVTSRSTLSQKDKLSTLSQFNKSSKKGKGKMLFKDKLKVAKKFEDKLKVTKKFDSSFASKTKGSKSNIDWNLQLNEMVDSFSNMTEDVDLSMEDNERQFAGEHVREFPESVGSVAEQFQQI